METTLDRHETPGSFSPDVADESPEPSQPAADKSGRDLDLPIGTQVGGYRIVGLIGRGGMAAVYAAVHPVIDKRVAIKVLALTHARNAQAVRRFTDEARAVNRIHCPNVIDIFTIGRLSDGRHYHVMELLEGESLAARLARAPLSRAEIAHVVRQTCSALDAVHQAGVVHRDLKPDNIFLCGPADAPTVKLLDFGVAKLLSPECVGSTQSGTALGTPLYMSPEQCLGRPVDARADVYALGVLLYRLFAGVLPFSGLTSAEVVYRHMSELARPPSASPHALALDSSVANAVDRLILSCLEKHPGARPRSSSEVWRALEHALAASTDRSSRWRWLGNLVTAAAIGGALSMVCSANGTGQRPVSGARAFSGDARPTRAPAPPSRSPPVSGAVRDTMQAAVATARPTLHDGKGRNALRPSRRSGPTRARALGLVEDNPFRRVATRREMP